MHDVGAGQLANQQRRVRELRDDRSYVLDVPGEPKAARKLWIDWHEPGVHVRIVAPEPEQAVGLNCLTAKNPERGRDDGYLNLGHGKLRTALQSAGRFSWAGCSLSQHIDRRPNPDTAPDRPRRRRPRPGRGYSLRVR